MLEKPPSEQSPQRSLAFTLRENKRYDWHKQPGSDYIPPIYATLDEQEWAVMEAWYDETEEVQHFGEAGVTFMCFIQGLVMGNMLRRVVQLGTYAGYSTLLLGFMLRRMGASNALLSVDISAETNVFTQRWVERAGLDQQVRLHTGDSADPQAVTQARDFLEGPPQLLIIDSSHQYQHTLDELERWLPELPQGGLVVMHDSGDFAAAFDSTQAGGVHRALSEWTRDHADEVGCIDLRWCPGGDASIYLDPCGLALLQKR